MSARIVRICLVAIVAMRAGNLAAANFTDMVIFGDSASDTGNEYDFTNGAEPAPPYYGAEVAGLVVWEKHCRSWQARTKLFPAAA
jgi:phospholipase/lecithinase/hemolysin